MRYLLGVPVSDAERKKVAEGYFSRKLGLRDPSDEAVLATVRAEVIADADEFLHQIASRSQTLLAVIAIAISLFSSLTDGATTVRALCIV